MKDRKGMNWLKGAMLLAAFHFSLVTSLAQEPFIRGNCLPGLTADDAATARSVRRLPAINTKWDAERTYPVAVVLMEAIDTTFTIEEPHDFYNRIFNEPGYNEGKGKGCVAEYFRDQSHGLLNLEFHIYGPVKVSQAMKSQDTSNPNYGKSSFREAMEKVLEENPDVDFSQYDWNNNGSVEQVIIVYAGFGGNETHEMTQGCIWPNTSSFSALSASGVTISNYSASPELWANNGKSCGIGTICHEFSHSLGLPDLYPTKSSGGYSVLDEWDLMDGGNFVNAGWCPPNYSVHEKMLLGWFTPEELSEPVSIDGMKPVADGGKAYIVYANGSSNEFFILENRQWSGWDLRTPGHGLLIGHVDYRASDWSSNTVNNNKSHRRSDYVHADNWDYDTWDNYVRDFTSTYYSGHNYRLSGTPYPLLKEDFQNNALTDSTIPAAVTFSDPGLLSKPITDIVENEDGTITFNFMGGTLSGIVDKTSSSLCRQPSVLFDLQGRRIYGKPARGLVIKDGSKMLVR